MNQLDSQKPAGKIHKQTCHSTLGTLLPSLSSSFLVTWVSACYQKHSSGNADGRLS